MSNKYARTTGACEPQGGASAAAGAGAAATAAAACYFHTRSGLPARAELGCERGTLEGEEEAEAGCRSLADPARLSAAALSLGTCCLPPAAAVAAIAGPRAAAELPGAADSSRFSRSSDSLPTAGAAGAGWPLLAPARGGTGRPVRRLAQVRVVAAPRIT